MDTVKIVMLFSKLITKSRWIFMDFRKYANEVLSEQITAPGADRVITVIISGWHS